MKLSKIASFALVLVCAGCGSSAMNDAEPSDPDEGSAESGQTPDNPQSAGEAKPIPLATWVEHLVQDYGDTAEPDTVADKVIEDTDDPGAFDAYLIETP